MRTRIGQWAPALVLFFLAPLVAEFLLGDVDLLHVGALVLLAPLYGGGAVLIREVVRWRGGGGPAIVLLALAYGVIEEGLVTQSWFNRHFAGLRLIDYGFVPAIGTSPVWTLFVLTIHVVWSISVPIVLTEIIFRGRGTAPWLGTPGLVVAGVLYVAGAVGFFAQTYAKKGHFMASPAQLAACALLALVLIAVALIRPGSRAAAPARASSWNPFALGAIAFAASTALHFVVYATAAVPSIPPAATFAIMVVLIASATLWVAIGDRRQAWGVTQRFALAAGAVLTYCWNGILHTAARGTLVLTEQVVVAAVAIALLALLATRVAASERRPAEQPAAPVSARG
jgi:hypothetical protein